MNTLALPVRRRAGRTRAALARLLAATARLFDRPSHEYLDEAALRDLGIGRSELVWFETHGLGAASRRSVFESLHRGM